MKANLTEHLKEQIEAVEAKCLPLEQIHMPLMHLFAPGIYCRQITMPRGTFVVGHEHKTEHFNVVLTGKARVIVDGITTEISAPCVFVSGAGVRKVLYIIEDMKWLTIHATDETNVAKLEELLIIKSDSFKSHEVKALKEGVA